MGGERGDSVSGSRYRSGASGGTGGRIQPEKGIAASNSWAFQAICKEYVGEGENSRNARGIAKKHWRKLEIAAGPLKGNYVNELPDASE